MKTTNKNHTSPHELPESKVRRATEKFPEPLPFLTIKSPENDAVFETVKGA